MANIDAARPTAATRYGLVTRTDLTQHRVTSTVTTSLLRRGELRRLRRGVYQFTTHLPTYPALALAAVLVCGTDAWASHRCALALWGLTSCTVGAGLRPGPGLEVVRPMTASLVAGLNVHRSRTLDGGHVTTSAGVPVTTVARTLADVAAFTGARQLGRWVTDALRQRLCNVADLHRVAHQVTGSTGAGRLRRVVEGLSEAAPSASELEILAREVLATAGLVPTRWERNTVSDRGEGWIGRVDCAFVPARVLVEFDSHRWHGQLHDAEADALRDRRLEAEGWLVLRFGWFDLRRRPGQVVAQIRAALAGHRAA